jgi:tRNA nucleotidyltransferase (CCA-adding enzyme)
MGLIPGDWDIATSALPEQVKRLFDKTVDTGIKHGTVTVLLKEVIEAEGNESYELTTFRIDGKYEDFRRPAEVEFSGSLYEDLARRDFTINAIAWHPDAGLKDPYNGMADIGLGLIRTVGNASERFHEDALRMLRAVRFSARFGFSLHEDVISAMRENNELIKNISSERIREELTGILVSQRPERFKVLCDTGLLGHILPEVELCFKTPQHNPYHMYNVGEHSLAAVGAIESDPCLRWTMLLHDIGKPPTRTTDEKGIDHFYGHALSSISLSKNIMERLRFDNHSIRRILRLIKYHDTFWKATCVDVRKAVAVVGKENFPDLLKVKVADKMGQSPEFRQKGLDYVNRLHFMYDETINERCCTNLGELDIDGNDLMSLGVEQGKEIRELLEKLLAIVIEHPEVNKRLKLMEIVQKIRNL